jgi:pimeloyl-ACP methyl ester carboxylesterase
VVETAVSLRRDDRVLPETRALGAFIVPFLLVAFAVLYGFPDDTVHWFAWEIHPTMTPLIMGAGYIAGTYFFARDVDPLVPLANGERLAERIPGAELTVYPDTGHIPEVEVADEFNRDLVAFLER